MASKKNFLINLTMDWDYLQEKEITPPWFSIDQLKLDSIAEFLQGFINTGDKIEVVAADDYLDFICIQTALASGQAQSILGQMSLLMNGAKKTTGKNLLSVTDKWRKIPLVSAQSAKESPPPFALFFQVRGSSDTCVGVWLSQLSAHMGVNPIAAAFTGKQQQSGHQLFSGLSVKLEEVFGVRFIKESGFGVI